MSYSTFSQPVRKLNSEVIGLDVHKSSIVYCRLDRRGRVVAEGQICRGRRIRTATLAAT